ncbi:succinyl-diaminopimelate desuccinylase [Parenemella sanctibonifatiensis]|nr:succinyl-diaminopimelate desuccinylase [Parenemella sanctibonifatiensis]
MSTAENHPPELDLRADLPDLLQALMDIESVSGNEAELADAVERAWQGADHLQVERDGNALVARTDVGRPQRVIIAGHLDTVPVADNLPSVRLDRGTNQDRIIGRGACDMKSGLAVLLQTSVLLTEPRWDVTWVCYDLEEVEESRNGLGRLARNHPEWLVGDFAVLMEPSNAVVEGGCQGTLRAEVTVTGRAAHSARAWMGDNAIHHVWDVLKRLEDYQPPEVDVDGLTYREGLNAVGITGGIATNVVPDACTVTINYRFAPDKDEASAKAEVARVLAGYELVWTDFGPPARPGLDRPLAQEFVRAVGGEPAPKFGWTDVARFTELGIPAVNYGAGDPSKAHADDEFCPVSDLYACSRALTAWLGNGGTSTADTLPA